MIDKIKSKLKELKERKNELNGLMDECNKQQPSISSEDSEEDLVVKLRKSDELGSEFRSHWEESKVVDGQISLLEELLRKKWGGKQWK